MDAAYSRRLSGEAPGTSVGGLVGLSAAAHHERHGSAAHTLPLPAAFVHSPHHSRSVSPHRGDAFASPRQSDGPSTPRLKHGSKRSVLVCRQAPTDRYIPYRPATKWPSNVPLQKHVGQICTPTDHGEQRDIGKTTYNMLLQGELLGKGANCYSPSEGACAPFEATSDPFGIFRFREPQKCLSAPESPYALSPLGSESRRLLLSPRKSPRKISKAPFKVLDAPELQDDFYLNLIDWSQHNVLGVGLGSCVYLWSARTSQVTKLTDLSDLGDLGDNGTSGDNVTSVRWVNRSSLLAVGTQGGLVHLWDANKCKRVRTLAGHTSRVGCLAGSSSLLSSGSRDRLILQRDIRRSNSVVAKLAGHRQEVCGLQWSPDDQHLASGGNDNKLFVWTPGYSSPTQRYTDHTAAVKAIAWSPHQHGLLASGGGTADQTIRFWNNLTGQPLQTIAAGSQVCNIAWSKNSNELVSTHGYSHNQIVLWRYPSMTQTAVLTGHSCRVLYLAMSPDGQTIVTGAGDETLRFWNVFSKMRSLKDTKSALCLFSHIR